MGTNADSVCPFAMVLSQQLTSFDLKDGLILSVQFAHASTVLCVSSLLALS